MSHVPHNLQGRPRARIVASHMDTRPAPTHDAVYRARGTPNHVGRASRHLTRRTRGCRYGKKTARNKYDRLCALGALDVLLL